MPEENLTCADLKRMGIIESEEEIPDCCPDCVGGKHEGEEENFPHVAITPKGKRVDFCCVCYDYVPVSALVGHEESNAWLDEALETKQKAHFHGKRLIIQVFPRLGGDLL